MYQLRGTQPEAVNAALKVCSDSKYRRELIIAPTAYGKSVIISAICKSITDGNILSIQPSRELLAQNHRKYIDAGGDAEIFSASFNSKNIGKVTFATVGSLSVEAFKDKNIKYILVDEAHLMSKTDSQLNRFVKAINPKTVLGFTASPVYLNASMGGSQLKMINRVRGKMFNNICHVTQIKQLVDAKFWSPIIYDKVNLDNNRLEYNSNGSDFSKQSLIENYQGNSTDTKILECIHRNPDRKSILVFVPTQTEAMELQQKIKGSEVVYSGMKQKDRDRIINSFKNLETRVVININILSCGFDHPQLDYIIGARPTASIAMWYQQIGRGVRIDASKKNLLYTDLGGNVERFGKLEDITFENIEGYGWGMFNGDKLLTGVPIWEENKPTKSSLIRKKFVDDKKVYEENIKKGINTKLVIWFGKYKNHHCENLVKKHSNYVAWMLSNKEFKWNGLKMQELKRTLLHLMREGEKKYN